MAARIAIRGSPPGTCRGLPPAERCRSEAGGTRPARVQAASRPRSCPCPRLRRIHSECAAGGSQHLQLRCLHHSHVETVRREEQRRPPGPRGGDAVEVERGIPRARVPSREPEKSRSQHLRLTFQLEQLAERQRLGAWQRIYGVLVRLAHVDQLAARVPNRIEVERGRPRLRGCSVLLRSGRCCRRPRACCPFGSGACHVVAGGVIGCSERHLGDAHRERLDDEEPAEQHLADPGDELDRLGRHHRAHDAAERAEHTRLGTRRHRALRWRLGEHVAQGDALRRRRRRRPEHGELRVETQHGAPHERQAEARARVGHGVARREVVGAVEHEVVAPEDALGARPIEALIVLHDRHLWREAPEAARGARGLASADVVDAVDDLPVQVARLDRIRVDDPDRADPRRREVLQRRSAEAPGSQDRDPAGGEAALPDLAELGQAALSSGSGELVAPEFWGRFDKRCEAHGVTLPPHPAQPTGRRPCPVHLAPATLAAHAAQG
ncbi:hypothetical protein PSCLAVI8L_220047 [Pseudoclavibacter sp. 8L]|nr:hypothetical protein PSCLAVI8L_220047 [Pseudoclavibacter sp. 8L]